MLFINIYIFNLSYFAATENTSSWAMQPGRLMFCRIYHTALINAWITLGESCTGTCAVNRRGCCGESKNTVYEEKKKLSWCRNGHRYSTTGSPPASVSPSCAHRRRVGHRSSSRGDPAPGGRGQDFCICSSSSSRLKNCPPSLVWSSPRCCPCSVWWSSYE